MTYIPDQTNWHSRGELFLASRNADETEFAAILEGTVPLERGIRDDIVADEHHSDIADHNYTWEDEDTAIDFVAEPLLSEIDRRIELLGESYPFRRVNSSLKYIRSSTLIYELCLAISIQKDLSSKPFNKLPILFELISAEAARLYLGESASAFRTGWPSHSRTERPTNFKDLLALLCAKTGEFIWNPSIPLPPKWASHAPKDEGVDFIAWKSFQDQRLGALYILGQCACGADWETKLTDIEIKRLQRWMHPITHVDFVKAFSTPHHIPGHFVLADVSSRAGLTFDRLRLTLIAEKHKDHFLREFENTINEAIRKTFPKMCC